MSQHEYSQPMSNGAPCSYNSLGAYNQGGAMAPVPHGSVTGKYVVPQYKAIGYDALTRGGNCSGYPSIHKAYGAGAGKCNQAYVTSLCGSCNQHGA